MVLQNCAPTDFSAAFGAQESFLNRKQANYSFPAQRHQQRGFFGWDLGFTVTTPRVSFAGSGAIGYDSTAVGQDIDESGNAIGEVATNTQGGLM